MYPQLSLQRASWYGSLRGKSSNPLNVKRSECLLWLSFGATKAPSIEVSDGLILRYIGLSTKSKYGKFQSDRWWAFILCGTIGWIQDHYANPSLEF